MDVQAGETAPGRYGLAARMRAGVADAVRSGGAARRLSPAALMSFLTAAAFAPLLVPLAGEAGGGEAAAVLTQVGGLGSGYLAGLLSNVTERARRSSRENSELAADSATDLAGEISAEIERVLGTEDGTGLRAEIADVLRGVDAIPAALAADTSNLLAPKLAELGEQVSEFRWVLGDLGTRLAEIQRTLVQQGVSQRSQILAARGELDTITGLLQRVVAATGPAVPPASSVDAVAAGATGVCPYPGLRPFESKDARWFFGRRELTAHLISRLAGQLDAGAPLFVLGPSGAGKSSLLRAGLIRGLRVGLLTGSRRWPRVLVSRPGPRPTDALATAAARAGSAVASLDGDPEAAAEALADSLLTGRTASRFVLIADQFEEVFVLDEAERLWFIHVLLALAARGALVVIAVRADFYGECAGVAELPAVLPDNQLMVGPLSEDELRRAITRPAAAVGCAVEPGLTELLLSDLGVRPGSGNSHEPGALPLLGYALRATWDRRSGRTLTVAGYRDAGGVHGAIADGAEWIYQDLPAETRRWCAG